jgi:hypothetical protein
MAKIIDKWRKRDPADYHTVEGFDAMKQEIGKVIDATEVGTPEHKIAKDVYHGIRNVIVAEAPYYAKAMAKYEGYQDLIKQLDKTLSLDPNATIDTALRKLQSTMRSGVNTNFGQRRKLVQELERAGAPNLQAKLAGQTLNPWVPSGLARLAVQGTNAKLLDVAKMPLTSPRIAGEVAHGIGRVQGGVRPALATARAEGAAENDKRHPLRLTVHPRRNVGAYLATQDVQGVQ